jgi:transposase-like protein
VTLAVIADLRRRFGLRDLEPITETTMTEERMALIELVEKQADGDLVREMLAFAAERIMETEVETRTGAAKGARTPMREVQRNGYRDRDWDTRRAGLRWRSPSSGKAAISPAFWSRAGRPRRPWSP